MAHWNDKTTSLPKPRSTHPLPTFLYAKNPYPISQKLSLSLGVGCSYSLLPVGHPWTFCTWMYGMQVLQEQKPAPRSVPGRHSVANNYTRPAPRPMAISF